jgi:hypothetical protein
MSRMDRMRSSIKSATIFFNRVLLLELLQLLRLQQAGILFLPKYIAWLILPLAAARLERKRSANGSTTIGRDPGGVKTQRKLVVTNDNERVDHRRKPR